MTPPFHATTFCPFHGDYPLGRTGRESYRCPMHPLRVLLIYVGVVFLGGALLAPWLAWGAQSLAAHHPVFNNLANHRFHRYVNRSLLGLALLGLWPLLRGLGVSAGRDVGLVKPAGQGRYLFSGFALGFASMAGVAVVALAAGAREVNTGASVGRWVEKISGVVLTAVVVAVVEEVLFRGAIFGAMRKTLRWPSAMVTSSAIYAFVHFFSQPPSPAVIHWTSGLVLLPTMLGGWVEVEKVVPGFFNLTLAGVLLTLAYQYTGNLYFSIGLHAGWIFWLKSYGFLTRDGVNASAWFWGTSRLIDGWVALIVLVFVGLALLKLRPRARIENLQPGP